ncbi:tyrosine-type recombinase/integrase [Antrihabitans stalactiti]|nr:site-specific integrase [Antrihabitans stalactiti]
MARPPLDIGKHGEVTLTKLAPNKWRARCRVRGLNGVTQRIQRDTPAHVARDSHGAAAKASLMEAVAAFVQLDGGGDGEVKPTTELHQLVVLYLADLDKSDRATRTRDTYHRVAALLVGALGKLRVQEATPRRLGGVLEKLAKAHGATTAKQAKTILSGVMANAVREGATLRNPVRDMDPIRVTPRNTAEGARRVLTGPELGELLYQLDNSIAPLPTLKSAKKDHTTRTVSQWAKDIDLLDPITLLAATGLRRSELLGLRWQDYDPKARTLRVCGHVIRSNRDGLIREASTKTVSSARLVPLPAFAVDMLDRRRDESLRPSAANVEKVIFPSETGQYRDPDNLAGQWRRIRKAIGFEWVSLHDFRHAVGTLLDEAGLSARIGADHLGHARVSMTQDVYQARGRVHHAAAQAIDAAIRR